VAKPPEVPDLELPIEGLQLRNPTHPPAAGPSSRPANVSPVEDLFGGGFERGAGSLQPPPTSAPPGGKAISFNMPSAGAGGDDWDDGIERGGGYQPAISSRQAPPLSSRAPASMNLDVAYRRPTAATDTYDAPSFLENAGGRALALIGLAAVVVPLVKYIHRPGRLLVTKVLPHAFDATSLAQSGAVAGVLLIASIAVGYLGLKARPRSWSMLLSACVILLSSLAMVTVALVSTDESPGPPDGARLMPYTIPLAFILLGFGVSSRGQDPYYDGGAKRLLPLVAGLCGGLLVYLGIALSAH
jgi:hypothetical protein